MQNMEKINHRESTVRQKWVEYLNHFLKNRMYLCILLLGTHSAVFGPAKYAFLPQALGAKEVVAGNGLVGMATFIAIVTGSITAGELVHRGDTGVQALSGLIVVIALAGVLFSRFIPSAPPIQAVRMN